MLYGGLLVYPMAYLENGLRLWQPKRRQHDLPLVSRKFKVTAKIDNDICELLLKWSFRAFSELNINQINNHFTHRTETPSRVISIKGRLFYIGISFFLVPL